MNALSSEVSALIRMLALALALVLVLVLVPQEQVPRVLVRQALVPLRRRWSSAADAAAPEV